MATSLEERILAYVQANSKDGRLLIKIEDLATALDDARNPIYKALCSLEKRRKIKRDNRSRMGTEITLLDKNYLATTIQSDSSLKKDSISTFKSPSLSLSELLVQIRMLSLDELMIVKDVVENNINKREEDN